MRAFIVRPFGIKEGIDFDRVETDLIRPALEQAGFSGGTTAEILEQGNIRTDMFEQLLTADLVIADLSIHNANVFYELGIRHAFRDKRTFLIKSSGDAVPFDLKTDRYFSYDRENPEDSLAELVARLRATRDSQDQDSPVFQLLPGLEPADASKFQVLPADFQEEVAEAAAARNRAHLQLLAMEADGLGWKAPALRLIARAQRRLRDWEGERLSWEAVRAYDETDVQANTELGSVYQRLGDLVKSDHALGRAIQGKSSRTERAEVRALMGRNAKARWEQEWRKEPDLAAKQEAALISGHLEDSFEFYRMGFREDRNHYYSGLNALAMATFIAELAARLPEVWEDGYDTTEEATLALRKLNDHRAELGAAVKLAIESKQADIKRQRTSDIWLNLSYADLICLTSEKPRRVAREYKKALAGAQDFERAAARKQLLLYEALGVLAENTKAGLDSIRKGKSEAKEEGEHPPRVLLFTGHRIDAPGRETSRFPAAKEARAREMIRQAVVDEQANAQGELLGIAGGANGGDILFLEICEELGIPARMFLVIPRNEYVAKSVQDGGPAWVERFQRIYDRNEHQVLSESGELPRWLRVKRGYNIWNRANLWMLNHALDLSNNNTTLIAFWNGQSGDGPGGTEDMVNQAKRRGAKFVLLEAGELVEEPAAKNPASE